MSTIRPYTAFFIFTKTPMQSDTRPERKPARKGFTLLEIVIAIALLAIIIGAVVTNVEGIFSSGQTSVAKMFVEETVKTPLMMYRINMGGYPTTEEGLTALVSAPDQGRERWKGPYVDKMPEDPWGNPYKYRYPGVKNPAGYDVWSMGPDKQDGTDDDIGNWQPAAGK